MSAPSTPRDRRVTVLGTPVLLERMVFSGKPYVVTNPGTYQPGKYRAALNITAGTVTIRDEVSP